MPCAPFSLLFLPLLPVWSLAWDGHVLLLTEERGKVIEMKQNLVTGLHFVGHSFCSLSCPLWGLGVSKAAYSGRTLSKPAELMPASCPVRSLPYVCLLGCPRSVC